jgi:hypothetical protein
MRTAVQALAFGLGLLGVLSGGAIAAEPIGKATLVRPSVKADGAAGSRNLARNAPIYLMDRLSTSSSGVGEITFDDGTKLAISSSARLTIDASVAPGSSRFKKLGLKAVGGSFRWVSGKSPSSAYKIQTPTASMAIRGTAFDVTIRGGKTYVVLLSGSARLCAGSRCQRLSSSCDYVVSGGGSISNTQPIEDAFRRRDEAARLFPFLSNPSSLSSRFRVSGSSCLNRIGNVQRKPKGDDRGRSGTQSPTDTPAKPSPPPSGGGDFGGPPPKP